MIDRFIGLVALSVLFAPLAASAAPGKITSLSAQPSSPVVGQAFSFQIGHTGKKCGFAIDPNTAKVGDPLESQTQILDGAMGNVTHTYSQAGSYSVRVTGKAGDKDACQGGPKTLTVVVQAPPPGAKASAGPARGPLVRKDSAKPAAGAAPRGDLAPLAPKTAARGPSADRLVPVTPPERTAGPTDRSLTALPVIEGILFLPEGGGTDPGVLAPGGRVFVKGRHLGTSPGRIVVKGPGGIFGTDYRYGEVELLSPKWESDTQANGRIPADIVQPMQRTTVEVRVHRDDGQVSAPSIQQFEVPSETRWLGMDDVELLVCSEEANYHSCNLRSGKGDFCADTSIGFDYDFRHDAAINGYHENCESTVGDDVGTDKWRIQLTGGWVFDSISWKGERPDPDFPKGATYWEPSFSWSLEPGEELHYWAKIQVRRPLP